ncbi:hypothetical protein [Reticulibacter mediterranei]|uniref:hypothetical protein n=1 Tax=Reticulibacter mediterranei TaxID=2778369 RepID=UPI001C688149|nr:hypothetical protein [Reticulibacter mediterranei]
MKNRFSVRKHLFLLSMLLLIVAILVMAFVLRSIELSQVQYYSYEDVTSWPPAHLAPGEKVPIIWQPSPDNTPPNMRSATITLTMLLVSDTNFKISACGAYPGAIILDTLQGDATSGRTYQRSVEIPAHLRAGTYELVRQITKRGIPGCLAKRIVISLF